VLLVGNVSIFRYGRQRTTILGGKGSERVANFLQGFQVIACPIGFSNCVAHASFSSRAHTGMPIVFNETDMARKLH
jgi:hypothetical protein